MRVILGVLVALGLGAAGCSCGQRSTPGDDGDGGPPDAALADAARPDGGRDGAVLDGGHPRPDGGVLPDAGACSYEASWRLVPRAIASVTWANGAPPRIGVTEQLLVTVPLFSGSCEELGGVDVQITQGDATDFIALTAHVWVLEGDVGCTADAPLVDTVVLVPGREQGNFNVVVADALSPGGGVRLTYGRDACSGVPDCQCYPGSPPGSGAEYADCRTDCSCAAGLACIGYFGFVGPLWSCLQPCADDRDCGPGRVCERFVADGPAYVCYPGDQCQQDADCPEGYECVDAGNVASCVDRRAPPTWQPCRCDQECAAGQRCTWDEDLADCLIPCRKDADCPVVAGDRFVCAAGDVCLPVN